MKNKIINFFYDNRIIDSHFGFWKFHMWLYLLATYYDTYLIGIAIRIHKWQILRFYINLNHNAKPHTLSFKFLIFGVGVDTDKKYNQQAHENYEAYSKKSKQTLKEFKDSLNPEQKELIKQYDYLK